MSLHSFMQSLKQSAAALAGCGCDDITVAAAANVEMPTKNERRDDELSVVVLVVVVVAGVTEAADL